MNNIVEFDLSALSDGQVRSKLWLLDAFEALVEANSGLQKDLRVGILASWYGTLPLFLLLRGKVPLKSLALFEIDLKSIDISRKLLEHWWIHGFPIEFHKSDINEIEYTNREINFIINTACEHVIGLEWYQKIPSKTWFIFQSTDMKHEQHINCPSSLEEFASRFQNSKIHFSDEIEFNYPDKSFKRFMIIGQKA